MARSRTEIISTINGGISAVAAVTGLLLAYGGNVGNLLEQHVLSGVLWLVLALAVILLVVGLSQLSRGLLPKSRLLGPEALLIDPDNPDHLRGRTDEIHRLSQAVTTRPLVFLEGESGSGKSALVCSGLIPALRIGGINGLFHNSGEYRNATEWSIR